MASFGIEEAGVLGDLNGDGVYDAADAAIAMADFGITEAGACPADTNGDGEVDGQDLAAVLANWSLPCGEPAAELRYYLAEVTDGGDYGQSPGQCVYALHYEVDASYEGFAFAILDFDAPVEVLQGGDAESRGWVPFVLPAPDDPERWLVATGNVQNPIPAGTQGVLLYLAVDPSGLAEHVGYEACLDHESENTWFGASGDTSMPPMTSEALTTDACMELFCTSAP
ncbi:MAG: hypothetical protein VYD99_09220 [Planctomycetota bacterium]|nr:hypothetical protein [Planctomycetota bacterium]